MFFTCKVKACEPLNKTVYRTILEADTEQPLTFQAGQYLNIHQPDGQVNPFSIANKPGRDRQIELHINRHDSTENIIQQMLNREPIRVELPLGDCFLPSQPAFEPGAPILLIAASTGYAQMQSIMLTLFENELTNPIHLYWGVKQAEAFYLLDQLEAWQRQYSNFHFTPVVSDATTSCGWEGREGLLHQVVVEDQAHLENAEVFISGSPLMVYATLDVLLDRGLPEAQAHSDVFSYAPRDK